MGSTIIRDRLNNRARVLRVRWHADGETLLKAGKYLEFADGLLRLMRQLDAISAALALLPRPSQFGFFAGPGAATNVATRGMGTVRPTRGPSNNLG